jgi:hypothetical protein
MKYCPSCRALVESMRVPVSASMDLLKCPACGRSLGQVSSGTTVWFSVA